MGIEACENRHSLDEFGPYKTFTDARKTLDVALGKLIDQGGGILCIPLDAPSEFQPRNLPQKLIPDGLGKPGVTIVDFRQGIEHTYLPPIGEVGSDVTGRASRILERDLASNLPWQDSFSTEMIDSRYLGGASSYLQSITRDVKAVSDRVDVPTLRGLFVGQTLLLTGQAGYGPPLEEVQVKTLGLDATGPHIIVRKAVASDHLQGAFLYNKNVINGLTVNDTSNCDNQSMSLAVNRVTYGIGDSFAVSGRISYQGSIMSAGGDEGAVGVAAQIEHDLDVFWGKVETWNATSGELVYQPSHDKAHPDATSPQKLGTSRPLINMNTSKWKQKGKVIVIPPNYSVLGEKPARSLIIASADVDWDESVVGRFIAINVPTEYYDAGESNSLGGGTGRKVHRWWQITGVTKRADGRWKVFVERAVWWSVAESGPTLFRWDNYSSVDDATKLVWLDYIIAPGAWVSDVRYGVTGDTPGNVGWAFPDDPRKILITPLPATSPIFEKDDVITNPPSADVWLGTGFRARHFDNFPAVLKGASFVSENSGRVQLGAGLHIDSAARTIHKIDPKTGKETAELMQKDGEAAFEIGVHILASTKVGIRIAGETQDDAIQLWQVQGRPQRITWIPEHASESALFVDEQGTFVLAGNHVNFNRKGAILQAGLSATPTPAHNLSGVNVPVPVNATELVVAFATVAKEEDVSYGIQVECSWLTLTAVTAKTIDGFKVLFGQKAPAGASLDWLLVR